ncbi:MAG: hypothetical protein FVQ82_06270 [Planctomycetes bacterium]|nr:hypothetical protein [Planctomycetota bacterium]
MKKAHILTFLALLLLVVQTGFHYYSATDEKQVNIPLVLIEWLAILIFVLMSFLVPLFYRWFFKVQENCPGMFKSYKYWLADDRREQTLAYHNNFGVITVAASMLFFIVFFEVMLNDEIPTYMMFVAFALHQGIVISMLVMTKLKFGRIPKDV